VSSNHFRSIDALNLDVIGELVSLRCFDLRHCSRIGTHGAGHTGAISARLGTFVTIFVTEQEIPREKKMHAADRDATLLRSQLEPHCIGVLRRRLALVYRETTDPDEVDREAVVRRLLELNGGRPRAARKIQGHKVSDELCLKLKAEMDL
jgi:hypothetical protein